MNRKDFGGKQNFRNSLLSNLEMACLLSMKQSEVEEKKTGAVNNDEVFSDAIRIGSSFNVFVMRWNPAISSFKMKEFEELQDAYNDDDDFYLEWNIWDHESAHVGDRFYMLKVGEGNTGIVMSGEFISEPFLDKDWSGQDRQVWYVRMHLYNVISPEDKKRVTISKLNKALPGVNWNEGHSGVRLTEEQAEVFDNLFEKSQYGRYKILVD